MKRGPRDIGVALALAVGPGCGPDEAGMQVRFQAQIASCDQPGLRAYLQVAGVPGVCPLQVAENRTVSGACAGVPTGQVRRLRITYYTVVDGREVPLAYADATVDLRGETQPRVVVVFSEDALDTDLDDDLDGRSNLEEFCAGTNPRRAD